MDAAEPPRILLEGAGPCASAQQLEALLRSSIGPARAPSAGWLVSLRIENTTSRVLRAEGDITDGTGTPIARRVVSGSPADCEALARAVGVWASLVLDAEVSRPPPAPSLGPSADSAPGVPPGPASRSSAPKGATPPVPNGNGPPVRTRDESLPLSPHVEPRALELGLGTFLMVGPAGQAFAGATPYAVLGASGGFFMRPSLAIGQGLPSPSSDERTTWATVRLDGCLRMHGLYPTNYGLKLDLCAGADAGFTYESGPVDAGTSATAPFVSLGPSVEMDGDVAGVLSLVLRGVAGVNIVPDGWSGRIEVAIAWRLR